MIWVQYVMIVYCVFSGTEKYNERYYRYNKEYHEYYGAINSYVDYDKMFPGTSIKTGELFVVNNFGYLRLTPYIDSLSPSKRIDFVKYKVDPRVLFELSVFIVNRKINIDLESIESIKWLFLILETSGKLDPSIAAYNSLFDQLDLAERNIRIGNAEKSMVNFMEFLCELSRNYQEFDDKLECGGLRSIGICKKSTTFSNIEFKFSSFTYNMHDDEFLRNFIALYCNDTGVMAIFIAKGYSIECKLKHMFSENGKVYSKYFKSFIKICEIINGKYDRQIIDDVFCKKLIESYFRLFWLKDQCNDEKYYVLINGGAIVPMGDYIDPNHKYAKNIYRHTDMLIFLISNVLKIIKIVKCCAKFNDFEYYLGKFYEYEKITSIMSEMIKIIKNGELHSEYFWNLVDKLMLEVYFCELNKSEFFKILFDKEILYHLNQTKGLN
jgi:hypothetical protein